MTVQSLEAVPQHLEALAKANTIKRDRARIRRDLETGATTVRRVFGEPAVQTATIAWLIAAQPNWGVVRTRKLLEGLGINERRRVSSLLSRQRELVLAGLGESLPVVYPLEEAS